MLLTTGFQHNVFFIFSQNPLLPLVYILYFLFRVPKRFLTTHSTMCSDKRKQSESKEVERQLMSKMLNFIILKMNLCCKLSLCIYVFSLGSFYRNNVCAMWSYFMCLFQKANLFPPRSSENHNINKIVHYIHGQYYRF